MLRGPSSNFNLIKPHNYRLILFAALHSDSPYMAQTSLSFMQRQQCYASSQPPSYDFYSKDPPKYSEIFCVSPPVDQLENNDANVQPSNYRETNESFDGHVLGATFFIGDDISIRSATSINVGLGETYSTQDCCLNQASSFHLFNEQQNKAVAQTDSNVSNTINQSDCASFVKNETIIVSNCNDRTYCVSNNQANNAIHVVVKPENISSFRDQANNVSFISHSQSSGVLFTVGGVQRIATSSALPSESNVDVTYIF